MSGALTAGCVHIVGAGLAGLAAAVALAAEGCGVRLYESSAHAGGRCRSYFDGEVGCRIDNGNHLLLAGNRQALDYLERIGARETLEGPKDAVFAFIDAQTGQRWSVRPNRGAMPWWIFRRARRVPNTRAADYLGALALRWVGPAATVTEALDRRRRLFRKLWEPLAVAALNTAVECASARLFWRILVETLGRGGAACQPLVPRQGLSETFVDPALAVLHARGVEIRFGARLRALNFGPDHVSELVFEADTIEIGRDECVILAVPAAVAARLVPSLTVPDAFSPIVNAHFRCTAALGSPLFVGVVDGTAEWIFRKHEVLSVTVSAADRIIDLPADSLREMLWRDVALAYRLPAFPIPPARIVKERRATFLASPEQLLRRPGTATSWPSLLLAGDYTDTGLPATIEGAIGSGFAAARQALARGYASPERAARRGDIVTATNNGTNKERLRILS
jgi:hydroxysqualene dehydroxylase